jgi:hypothetical protein
LKKQLEEFAVKEVWVFSKKKPNWES